MSTSSPSPETGPLRRLGSAYILLERLGTGSQGEVWRARRSPEASGAWDPEGDQTSAPSVNEDLAAKILRSEIATQPGVLERFLAERATLMRVSSPSVVTVRDLVVEGQTFAIVMDLVDGGDLSGYLAANGPLAPAEIARVGAAIAEGLTAVHAAGVLHRDIKPANVLLERHAPGTPVVPRLADFGVARISEAVGATASTDAIGTPLYMAPEVLTGKVPPFAADIYSLGAVFYEMACGVPPFTGSTPQVLANHARRDPGRPQGVPDQLWELICQMLDKQASARPSAAQVAARLRALEGSLAGLPAAPRLTSPPLSTAALHPFEWDAPAEGAAPASHQAPTLFQSSPAAGASGGGHTYGSGGAMQASSLSPATGPGGQIQAQPGGGISPLSPAAATYNMASPGPTASSAATSYGLASAATSPVPPNPVPLSGQSVDAGLAQPKSSKAGLAVVVGLVVCLVLVGVGGLWWWSRGASVQPGGAIGPVAALPLRASTQETQRISDVGEGGFSPDGQMVAVRISGEWKTYDLSRSDQAPVWSGDCYKARFWTNDVLLCSSTGKSQLVGKDGQVKKVAFGDDLEYMGTTGTHAIVHEGGFQGALKAMDAEGTEVWRHDGGYSHAKVNEHFILTYEDGSDRVQVLDAQSGAILYSQPYKGSIDWDEERPAGVDINIGGKGFFVQAESATVYDATGSAVGEVAGETGSLPSWVVSGPVEPKRFLEALNARVWDSSRYKRVLVFGASETATVVLDTNKCSVSEEGKEDVVLKAPEHHEGELCRMMPQALVGGDKGLLFTMGEPSSQKGDTGSNVVVYDRATGQETWRLKGSLSQVLVPLPGASGDQASAYRVVVLEGEWSKELVVHTIVPQ